jgi:hypothetical protein
VLIGNVLPTFTEELADSIRVSCLRGLLAIFLLHHSEHGDSKLFQDVDNKVPINMASNPNKTLFSINNAVKTSSHSFRSSFVFCSLNGRYLILNINKIMDLISI